MQIEDGKVVLINYTLRHTDADGEILDSSDGGEPLAYLHGAQNIVPGLEAALTGLAKGAEKQVTVTPEEGYGERDEHAIQQVPRGAFPAGAPVEVGMQFVAETPDGQPIPVTIAAVDGDTVTVDANHPLAGTTLHFSISIVDVRDATAEEKLHGHAHGPGGAHHH